MFKFYQHQNLRKMIMMIMLLLTITMIMMILTITTTHISILMVAYLISTDPASWCVADSVHIARLSSSAH